ncbi:MAG: class I tRNA ligase family protein [Candidatus Pacebacteria bacterium]|nr:class I tRNA ligase family protein [Candidatus Paceibacterota bacterium]
MNDYDHKKIEGKWQKEWEKQELYKVEDKDKDNFYTLVEFPYSSGNLHIGHWYTFAVPDIYARYMRMTGKNVLYPIGFDSFGLPAENAAIKRNLNPKKWTDENIEYMRGQLKSIGASFDWSRELKTSDPDYYKWTQYIFTKMFEKGLAYKSEAAVNWCPSCMTVLANEQVVNGLCERCDTEVEKKKQEQWMLKITDYTEDLLSGLDDLDWPEEIKESQRNWIGKSRGMLLKFKVGDGEVSVFTTRPDTICGVTYIVLAPEHPLIDKLDINNRKEVEDYIGKSLKKTELERQTDQKEKTGVKLEGVFARNPITNEEVPVYVADYVLAAYGTGAVMAVPAHDDRDFDFANKFGLPIKEVVIPNRVDKKNPPVPGKKSVERQNVHVVVKNPKDGKYLLLKWKEYDWTTFPMGGVEEGESLIEAAKREVLEETGYKNLINGKVLGGQVRAEYFAAHKDENRVSFTNLVTFDLENEEQDEVDEEESSKHEVCWVDGKDLTLEKMTHAEMDVWISRLDKESGAYTGDGVLVNSDARLPIFGKEHENEEFRKTITGIVQRKDGKILCVKWKEFGWTSLPIGGIDKGELPEEAAPREVLEETGYKTKVVRRIGGPVEMHFYAENKKVWRNRLDQAVLLELIDDKQEDISKEETERHECMWLNPEEAINNMTHPENRLCLERLVRSDDSYTEGADEIKGYNFNGIPNTKVEIPGEKKTTYRLRDWSVGRQRYWGTPIPVVYDPEGNPHPIPEENLPWTLPEDVDFKPTGEPPLAKSKELKERTEKIFGEGWRPEVETMDTFLDSSWYFLRYIDPRNKKEISSKDIQKNWMPVDQYFGGSEHTTMHLLFARFFQRVLYDLGMVTEQEPFKKRLNRGLIMGPDGSKMSKSKGNVVDPDEVVERVGADTVRMYLAFIGPYAEVGSYPWDMGGIVGIRRFLERVNSIKITESSDAIKSLLQKTIKKVTDDFILFKFNTAISSLMIFLNSVQKEGIGKDEYLVFLRLLAPFAPHLLEELWKKSGMKESIHLSKWPKYDESMVVEEGVKVMVQIDGKVRGSILVDKDISDNELEKIVTSDEKLSGWISKDYEVKKVVKNRLISLINKSA